MKQSIRQSCWLVEVPGRRGCAVAAPRPLNLRLRLEASEHCATVFMEAKKAGRLRLLYSGMAGDRPREAGLSRKSEHQAGSDEPKKVP